MKEILVFDELRNSGRGISQVMARGMPLKMQWESSQGMLWGASQGTPREGKW